VISKTTSIVGSKSGGRAVMDVPRQERPTVKNDLRAEMVEAFGRHQTGDLAAAARGYQSILARDPNHADAAHLLGVVLHQQGQSAKAVELINRAVALRPSVPAFHANLAEAYRATGQFDRAVGCGRAALQLWKDYPEAHNNLGLALQALGRHDEALEHFKTCLDLRPGDAMTHSNIGTVYRSLGQTEPALEHFQRAVELNPRLAQCRTNLGQFLLDLGRAEQALPHCQEAVALQPDLAEAHNNLGNVHRAMEQYTEARVSYFEAMRLKPDLTQALANLGLSLLREGRLDESLPWLQRATELEPKSHLFLEYLAEALSDKDRHSDAIEVYEKMIQLEPARPLSYNSLGSLYQEDGRFDDARQQFQQALGLQPNFPLAHISVGGLEEELGNMEVAQACFRKALECNPGHPIALARLATLLRDNLPDDDLALVELRLNDTALDPMPRASLQFGLAHVLDSRHRYDEAAQLLSEANAASQANLEKKQQKYQPDDHERYVANTIAAFRPEIFSRLAGAGLDTRRPVFVFGLPRSGTTLIEQVLASHSMIHGAGEMILGRKDLDAIPGLLNRNGDPPLLCLGDPRFATVIRKLAADHDARLAELGESAARVVDKMPDNYMHLGLLALLFPNATFIHCRRDLRDIAVSCWMTNFRSIRWANSHEQIASRFTQYLRIMDHWRTVLPTPIVEVDYEQTVDDLESVGRRLVAACGLEWEPACLDFHQNRRPVRTASVTQVRQPVYRKSLARWKNYQQSLASLFAALPPSLSMEPREQEALIGSVEDPLSVSGNVRC
jgi:tetratricopeptide (TPR) repeat protein